VTTARADAWPPLPPPVGPVDEGAVEAAAAELSARCPGRLGERVPLAPLTTFRLGGPARLLLHAERTEDLVALAEVLAATRLPLLVLGRGSNLLVADAGWPGVVVRLGERMREIAVDGDEVEAGGAAPLPSLAARTAAASLGGLAFAVAIPGSVGGGVRMNAGAHGSELADRLVWAEVVDLAAGAAAEPMRRKPDELGLSYRRSALPPTAVVTAARFACEPAPEERVREEIAEARRWRRDNQPVNQPNCGSVFANPLPLAAGHVVERLGMKGERSGGARVSEIHANFIVAADGARSADVLELIRRAMRRARDELGIELRTEVQLVGDFTQPEASGGSTGPEAAGNLAGPEAAG
jgi:UDP-N-acetylmuramate dehydrogenase